MKSLIIVESPAKAKTISNFLNKDYKVIASKGHLETYQKVVLELSLKITNLSQSM